jgi:hypothetical protein
LGLAEEEHLEDDGAGSPRDRTFLRILMRRGWSPVVAYRKFQDWCAARNQDPRSAVKFLKGRNEGFRDRDMIVAFMNETVRGCGFADIDLEPQRELTYVQDFVDNNRSTAGERLERAGTYQVLRPGTEGLFPYIPVPWDEATLQFLKISGDGPNAPMTFTYHQHDDLQMWSGYVVGHGSLLYLLGLCDEGRDASFVVLRPHPAPEFASDILVGVQTLMLAVPEESATNFAVTRRLAAVRHLDGGCEEHCLKAAQSWIDAATRAPGPRPATEKKARDIDLTVNFGLFVDLSDRRRPKS